MYISNSFSPDELRKSGILKSEVLGSTILPSIICDQCITLYICDSLCVEALVTASVFVPPVHVLGNVNYLGLNDWGRRGSGGLSNGGGSGNNKLFLSRRGSNRGGLLLLGLGARRLRGAADFDLAVRGSLRRRRCGCGLIILSVRSVTSGSAATSAPSLSLRLANSETRTTTAAVIRYFVTTQAISLLSIH